MFIKFKFVLFFLLTENLYASAFQMPQPSADSCDFYTHLDALIGCSQQAEEPSSLSNYLLRYGLKYCNIYLHLQNQEGLSQDLINWLEKVRLCLQQDLFNNAQSLACHEIGIMAFNSHPRCYEESGFNSLSFEDKSKIWRKLDFRDLLNQPLISLSQACSIGKSWVCNAVYQMQEWNGASFFGYSLP